MRRLVTAADEVQGEAHRVLRGLALPDILVHVYELEPINRHLTRFHCQVATLAEGGMRLTDSGPS